MYLYHNQLTSEQFRANPSLVVRDKVIIPIDENLKTGIPAFKSIDVNKGKYGGSWIHPDLAVHLAMWISPTFGIQVSGWVRELALCGSVRVFVKKRLRNNY